MLSPSQPWSESNGKSVYLLTAVRNEADFIGLFLSEIRDVFLKSGLLSRVKLVIVDDGSTDNTVSVITDFAKDLSNLRIEVLQLSSNRGNQSAMAYGVRHLARQLQDGHLLTFDADGEDDITRLPELVRMLDRDANRIIFVYRDSRKEDVYVRAFYYSYRILYRILTGRKVIPCNVMAIPGTMIPAIAGSPLLSLHFSYPPLRLGLPYQAVPMARRQRYGGRSSQNIGLLFHHALIGLTIFYEDVVARLMLFSAGLVGVTLLVALGLIIVRFAAPHALPVGFTTVVFMSLFGFGFVTLVLLISFCLACSTFRLLIEQSRD
ncbi:MAG: glycosyltransferase [Gammaproteobacteria bacterium]|nr:glycosyltransferase [Gammaproteobacteria bacterium]